MRVLFTFAGGFGHLQPMVPLARAVAAAGHEVAVAAGPARQAAIESAGFTAFPVGPPRARQPAQFTPLLPPDRDREDHDLREHFARRGAGMRLPLYLALFEQWRPDVVVREECDYGSALAAEKLGQPYANFQVIASGSFGGPAVIGEPLAELRAANDLPPDPDLRMLHRDLLISPVPPSFRHPGFPLPDTGFSIRTPTWPINRSGQPLVYFTLGTEFNLESGDLFHRVFAGLRDVPAQVVATVGSNIDPADFGPQPGHIRIERFIPQSELLPKAHLVISHGGSGSVLGALTHGVPTVLLPMGADQPHNADQVVRLGAGRELHPIAATPAEIRATVTEVLANPAYRQAAEQLQAENHNLPDPAEAIPLLEKLAGSHRARSG